MCATDPVSDAHLIVRIGRALRLNQRELAERIGVSRRTISRWTARGAVLAPQDVRLLAGLLHPVDPALAADVATTHGQTLESLGLEGAPPAALAGPAVALAADAVVCAAADALDVSPRAVRPALLAAFRRAREAGVTLDQLETALAPAAPPARGKK